MFDLWYKNIGYDIAHGYRLIEQLKRITNQIVAPRQSIDFYNFE